METSAAMRTLNPATAALDPADAAARRWLFPLIFETLVTVDVAGGFRGVLAREWEPDPDAARWRFQLRPAVRLHDGTPLDSGRIAAALSASEPAWRITADVGSITIESDRAMPDLLWQLADGRHAIAFGRAGGGEPIGTGPFAIDRWEPKRLRLRAHEDHWSGRPFVDALQVDMARPLADQITSIELGRADFVALRVQDVRRAVQRGFRIVSSAPRELVALVFSRIRPPVEPIRLALTLAIDRSAMWSALLQRQGEPAAALLPQWLSGYAVILGMGLDRERARQTVAPIPAAQRVLTLRIKDADPLLRSIAERVAVEARDVGLTINVNSSAVAPVRPTDIQLMRVGLDPAPPERALSTLVTELGIPLTELTFDGSGGHSPELETVYRSEQTLLDQHAIVPLVHLPEIYAVGPHVDGWNEPMVRPSGAWNLANAWLKTAKP